ncbi:UPF0182 family protein [Capilliphycus salinus ALCB114379]|uniref:UPF0182 family protein n=1 Tax=Capilliphycus salinus TaxID=2768948 RepID=UPI0039A533D2
MAIKSRFFQAILILFGLWLLTDLVTHIVAEGFWFQELGYLSVYWLRITTRAVLWFLGLSLTAGFLLGNLVITNRYKYPPPPPERTQRTSFFSPEPAPALPALDFSWLLGFVISLSLLLALVALHYGTVFIDYWKPDFSEPLVAPLLPERFDIAPLVELIRQLFTQWWLSVILVVITLLLIFELEFSLIAIALFLCLGFGLVLSSHWTNVLQYFNPTSFNQTDDIFGQNISFYIFTLPVAHLLEFWLVGLFLCGLISCTLIYLHSGNSLSQGRFPGFSQPQQRHLHALGGMLMLSIAFKHWLSRYELLYSERGVIFGAGYTDVNIQAPADLMLCIVALIIAIFLFWQAFFSVKAIEPLLEGILKQFRKPIRRRKPTNSQARLFADSYSLRAILGWYLTIAFIAGWILPATVQRFIVQPNEIEREAPYLERSIGYTRQAFNLDEINSEIFDPEGELTYADILENDLTIKNIRLWDERPLLQTNRQLQQIRLYYEFPDANVDRYTLLKPPAEQTPTDRTEKQQVLIAARELNYNSVPTEAQTWVNKHLVYTHGYGFTLSPVNTVGEGGLPNYFVRDIGADPKIEPESTLEVDQRVEYSIPIGEPRIYYGELTDTNIMTSTQVKELDYPLGNENVYNTYDGRGGILIGRGWGRLLFAKHLKNWQMVFARNFLPDTKLLFRRNIKERVKMIAPFLRYDSDPYLVVADANLNWPEDQPSAPPNYLYWIIDAYTTSDRYPYSDPGEAEFNYIRNSVKVVVDAYNGTVRFYYLNDPEDPILTTWRKIFPELFKPIQEMPGTLYVHIRYPVDLFKIQSEQLLTYHMDDVRVFYNREDQWRIPKEIYANQPQSVEPYYLIMRLPKATDEEFILLQPFTPASRINLVAWMAARSDIQNYGKLLLYRFPKQEFIFGPEQVEALINQTPEISEQISLWNRQGSRVVQGNLLVIPIERSLLYVEPIYLEATENSLPTLARVIVFYNNSIVMRPSLQEALQDVFEAEPAVAPTTVPPPTNVDILGD